MSADISRFYRLCYSSLFFFFLMIRRPPRSTLFPTRRSSDLSSSRISPSSQLSLPSASTSPSSVTLSRRLARRQSMRSEEHTSELQSLAYLVCRLLLEKKKHTSSTSLGHRDTRTSLAAGPVWR